MSKYIIGTVACCVLLAIGFFFGSFGNDKIGRYNLALVTEIQTNISSEASSNLSPASFEELVSIWESLHRVQTQIDDHVNNESALFRIQEGLLTKRYSTARLAPVLRGILEGKHLTIVQYYQLELAYATYLQTVPTNDFAKNYLFAMEGRRFLIKELLEIYRPGERPLVFPEIDLKTHKRAEEFVKSHYATLRDCDDAILLAAVKRAYVSKRASP